MENYSASESSDHIEPLSLTPIQPEFESLVDEARETLAAGLGVRLDSLYLYGSVARGCAQSGRSDLDLTLVLTRHLSARERVSLEKIRLNLEVRHREVAKIDFDLGVREDILNSVNLYSWGYWLKHECRCIYGENLAQRFDAFKPSRAIAEAVNGDYIKALNDYADRILNEHNSSVAHRLQKEAARKLIRATNVLRPLSDKYWPRTLEEYVQYFSKHYPEMAKQIDFFLMHTRTPGASNMLFNGNLISFVEWMRQQQLSSTSA